jgi:hypothetical protein
MLLQPTFRLRASIIPPKFKTYALFTFRNSSIDCFRFIMNSSGTELVNLSKVYRFQVPVSFVDDLKDYCCYNGPAANIDIAPTIPVIPNAVVILFITGISRSHILCATTFFPSMYFLEN